MADINRTTGGFWAFLPFALTVLGAAIGIWYVTAGGGNANPVIWLVIGAIAGRLLAWALLRLSDAAGWRR